MNSISIEDFKLGLVMNNDSLVNIFNYCPRGGMRRSHKTNSLVLISRKNKPKFNENNLCHFTGMGRSGDLK